MKLYVVDAFTDEIFKGNPAAVCILDRWLSDTLMQNITNENNLSETAFAVRNGNYYDLRWFTPGGEIDLCGHATLAAAYVIMSFVSPGLFSVTFQTKSGQMEVQKQQDLYEMDMPAYQLEQVTVTSQMELAIGMRPIEAWLGRDLICVLENEEQVIQAMPDKDKVIKLEGLLLQLTAKGRNYDCVTRSFAPKLNVWEDPVCGSGHCHVIPLWADKLKKSDLCAFQASRRTGILYCHMQGSRVKIAGKAALYSISELFVPEVFLP